jgi:DNA invertase Pin-like site-specific DNA recombinase
VLIGYARVSTDDQNLALQRDALAAAGCEKIYEDKTSGAKAERPGLGLALEVARAGDTLIVWRLDRLGRSLKDLIALAEALDKRGVGLNPNAVHFTILMAAAKSMRVVGCGARDRSL